MEQGLTKLITIYIYLKKKNKNVLDCKECKQSFTLIRAKNMILVYRWERLYSNEVFLMKLKTKWWLLYSKQTIYIISLWKNDWRYRIILIISIGMRPFE